MLMTSLAHDADALRSIKVEVEEVRDKRIFSKIPLNLFFNYLFYFRMFAKLARGPLKFPIKIN